MFLDFTILDRFTLVFLDCTILDRCTSLFRAFTLMFLDCAILDKLTLMFLDYTLLDRFIDLGRFFGLGRFIDLGGDVSHEAVEKTGDPRGGASPVGPARSRYGGTAAMPEGLPALLCYATE